MKIVQKYGGSSLSDPDCVRRVARRIVRDAPGNRMLVVVSAQGKTTDSMTQNFGLYSDGFPSRESDSMLVCGEQISASLLTATLHNLGCDAISLNGVQVPICASGSHGDGRIERIETSRIRKEWERGRIVVVTGFQGVNKYGDQITLGRGGSDTSAVALAAALKADLCQIFTDVDGVYSADPRKVQNAVRFDSINEQTMLDLALGGAKVLHPRATQLAIQYSVPTEILSSFSESDGTTLSPFAPRRKGITLRKKDDGFSEITITFSDSDACEKILLGIARLIGDVFQTLRFCRFRLSLLVPSEQADAYLFRLHNLLYNL